MTASRATLEQAQARLRAGDAARAAKLCAEVLTQEPDSVPAMLILSAAELKMERPDPAIAAARKALDLAPQSAMAPHQLGLS